MPIDPAIALQVKPIQIESPLSGFQKAIALKNSVNAQALQEQQAEENRINIEAGKLGLDSAKLKLDQDRRAADDNDLLTATTMKHTTYDDTDGLKTDDDAVIKSLMAAGKPALASAYAKNQAEIKTSMTTKVIKDLELELKQKERLGSWAATLHNASPEDKPRLWPVVLQGIAAERLLPPEQLAQFPPQYSPEMDPQIEAFVQQSKTSTVQATEHLAKLNAQREAAENLPKLLTAAGQILGAATNDAEWAAGRKLVDPKVVGQFSETFSPAEAERAATLALTPEQRLTAGKGPKTPQDALAMVDQIFSPTDKDPSMVATNRRYKGMLSALNFTPAAAQKIIDQAAEERKSVSVAQNTAPIKIDTAAAARAAGANATFEGDFTKTGLDFLPTIPLQWRKTVEKVANYTEDPTKVASLRGSAPMREKLMAWVNQVNPDYDTSEFQNRAPTRKAFTTGTQGQQINAINTAIGHIGQLVPLAAALDSGSFVPGNKLWNWARTTFGSDKVTNFDTLKDALAGEVASVLSKGVGTVSGIAEAKEKIHAANSPAQLAGYIRTLLPIMGSKLASLNYQYHQAMGVGDPFQALTPEARTILTKHGIDPDDPLGVEEARPTVVLPKGNGKEIDRETAVKFYEAAGRDPAKAETMAKQNGWKIPAAK